MTKTVTAGHAVLTRDLAFASGYDAANRQMRSAGRKKWNAADASLSARVTNKLLRYVPFSAGGLMGLPEELLAKLDA